MSQGVITRPGKRHAKTDNKQTLQDKKQIPSTSPSNGSHKGHEWVDLGLPSGVKWATCNLGAKLPSEHGDYYAWGETTTKLSYTENSSKTYKKNMGDIAGNSQFDAARAKWGGLWRLPTKTEFEELLNKCKLKFVDRGGIKGYLMISKINRNSIFLPVVGWYLVDKVNMYNGRGNYWSSTPDKSKNEESYSLVINSFEHRVICYPRDLGFSVRPVMK